MRYDIENLIRNERARRHRLQRRNTADLLCYWLAALVGTVAAIMYVVQKWGPG